jgi:hypothetical protein
MYVTKAAAVANHTALFERDMIRNKFAVAAIDIHKTWLFLGEMLTW